MFAKFTRRTAILAVLSFAAACAPSQHRPLDAAKREAASSSQVIAVIPQPEINAEIVVADSSGAVAQYGLLGALIGSAIDAGVNSSRAEDAEKSVAPLRDVLLGYDFDTQLKQELERALPAVQWLSPQGVSVSKDAKNEARSAELSKTGAANVMYFIASYSVSPDFSTLNVKADVTLLPKQKPYSELSEGEKKKRRQQNGPLDLRNALYHNLLEVNGPLVPKGAGIAENQPRWADGALIKRALQFQAAELARLVTLDLPYVAPAKDAKPTGELYGEGPGRVVEKTGPVTVVRMPDGSLKSIVTLAELPTAQASANAAP